MAAEEGEARSQWQHIQLCAVTLQTRAFGEVFAQVGLC